MTEKTNSNNKKTTALPEEARILEAVLFASSEVLSPSKIKEILPGQNDTRKIRKLVEHLNIQFQKERHPFEIVEIGGGFQFRTISFYHQWVRKLFKEKAVRRISTQALECLAIIAYRQPLTKAEIESVRGVLSDGAVKSLLEKDLITIAGRSDKPGRPLLYATTQNFLCYFGIKNLKDLPDIKEFESIAKEKMDEYSEIQTKIFDNEEENNGGNEDGENRENGSDEKKE